MPKIQIDKVISFSSEDPQHTAANILNSDPSKKWKCKTAGETSTNIVLQLDKPYIISSIDIGNEHSAYIEIQANRSSSNDEFKVLLLMSSFMTPLESRQSQNIHKVRMFNSEQLSSPECEQKWDRIKIICSQPFNRHVQYGISFLTLHSKEDCSEASVASKNIGKFTLRPDSPNNISIGSLFARRNELEGNSLKGAAAIRNASNNPSAHVKSPLVKKLKQTPSKKPKLDDETPIKDRNRNDILYTDDDDKPNEKIDKLLESKKKEEEERKTREENQPKKTKEKATNSQRSSSGNVKEAEQPSTSTNKRKLHSVETPKKKQKVQKDTKIRKPFDKLLEGVVFTISGIANPERGNIRTYALEIGAKYKPNWDDNCTHLICAFMNTPKFNEVQGKGKIVTKKWIIDCHSQRKRLPWRRYALDPKDKKMAESEDEIEEGTAASDTEIIDDADSSSSDLEAEIERIRNAENKASVDAHALLPNLPDIFANKLLYIDNELDESDKKLIRQYVHAYNGKISTEIKDNLNAIITDIEGAVRINDKSPTNCPYLTADWIWECHNNQKLMPFDDFQLS